MARGAATGAWSGDQSADSAVGELYAAHWRGLVRIATLLVSDLETAEDVVQDAFIAFHGRWTRLRDPELALAYLRRSVVNGARSALRRRSVATRYLNRHGRAQAAQTDLPAEERALARSGHADVLRCLQQLPERQREVVVLRYYVDLSEVDTAAQLGISRGAVKSHASRGLAKLRDLLPVEPAEDAAAREGHRGGTGDE